MIRIREAIVVEGRYDRARLASAVDAVIVETSGFAIFRDREQLALLRLLAEQRGLLILTDSDGAGFLIRDYLGGAIPSDQVKHAYIPEIRGKEPRKRTPSGEGLLGVEGVDTALIVDALRRAGATIEGEDIPRPEPFLDKARLYADGLSGRPDSAARRARLLARLGLPSKLSANRLIETVNAAVPLDRYAGALAEVLREMPLDNAGSR